MPLEIPYQSGLTFVKFSFLPLAQDLATEKWKKTIFFGRSYELGGLYPSAEKLGFISIPWGSLGGMFFKFIYTVVRM
jgi:hypothetical protein